MNKQTITFTADEQTLTKTGGIEHYASNIVSYIEASFTLGDNWAGYDSIRAVWESGYARIATVLDANNKCIVPAEVLTYKSKVNVNLVGSIVENTVLTDRLTTYPILALTVDADARVDSSETTPVTASQFEQFVDVVRDEASAIQNYTYDSEAWAVGQRAGVDVPSTDETYQNNAKYYADQGATLQQEVTDLKSDFGEAENGIIHIPSSKFANGALQSDGTVNTQQYYASTIEDIQFDYPVRISIKGGYKYIFFYKSGTSWANMGWMTTDYFVGANTKFRLQIGRVTETWGNADLNEFSRKANIISKGFANTKFNSLAIAKLQSGDEPIDAKFLRGTLSSGNFTYATYRICTSHIVRYNRPITIKAETGFRFAIHTFNSSDQFVADLGWKTIYSCDANQGLKIIVARTTENTSEMADVFEYYSAISVTTDFKTYVDNISGADNLLSTPMMGNGRAKLVAHMGYHVIKPQNTLPAFEEAGKLGYWGIESDLQQTSDGYYVMCHDTTVDATTDGSGTISSMTLAQIRALHITADTSLQIPTFEEYLSTCKRYGCIPIIEIKGTVTNTQASYETIIGIVKKFGFSEKNCIFIGSKYAIGYFKSASPSMPFMPVYQAGSSYDWDAEFALVSSYKNVGLDWDYSDTIALARAEQVHNKNMLYGTFTVDSAQTVKELFEKGVDFVTTNTVLPTD